MDPTIIARLRPPFLGVPIVPFFDAVPYVPSLFLMAVEFAESLLSTAVESVESGDLLPGETSCITGGPDLPLKKPLEWP